MPNYVFYSSPENQLYIADLQMILMPAEAVIYQKSTSQSFHHYVYQEKCISFYYNTSNLHHIVSCIVHHKHNNRPVIKIDRI